MDAIGIHAVFGGFILGVCMPKAALTEQLRASLQPFVVVFLLPMFFTFSGLKTQLGVMMEPQILLASFCGENNRDAMALGSLINARGLMDLILINIELQAGVIEPGCSPFWC